MNTDLSESLALRYDNYQLVKNLNMEKKYGIFMMDIDKFKLVNDNYGHDSGDMVLKQFGARLIEKVRNDDVVARVVGEEFILILKDIDEKYPEHFAEIIRHHIEYTAFNITQGKTINITTSIGFILYPFFENFPVKMTFDQMLSLADKGLYHAKQGGRNISVRVRCKDEKSKETEVVQTIVSDIAGAIGRRRFTLRYALNGLFNKREKSVERLNMIFNKSNNITFIGSEAHYTRLVDQFGDLISNSTILPENISARLALIVVPVELKLYVASQCPHCPGVIRTLIPLALSCPHIHLKIIDGTIATEEASADKIMSVPCLILDNGFRWTGAVNADEVVDMVVNMIINRDPSGLTTLSLKMILEDGKADWIVKQMLEYNTMFKGFTGLITHETWSVRLGAMVVLEEIAEKAPGLALTIAPELLRCLQDIYFINKGDIPTQGDILYALGEIGDETVKDEITRMIEEQHITHPEILEAAKEAIESIESRI